MKLLVIGCGNMGSAIVRAVLGAQGGRGLGEPGRLFESVTVVDPSEGKMEEFKEAGCTVLTSLDGFEVEPNTMVVLAVKPQNVDEALGELKNSWSKCDADGAGQSAGSFLVSIAAGVSIERLKKGLGSMGLDGVSPVVRVMPNIPAQVGLGASGWMAAAGKNGDGALSAEQKAAVVALLDLMGASVEVATEDQLDAVTALSGCGPAYVFYFMEALIEGGEKLGLSRAVAERLAVQTMKGAVHLAAGEANARGENLPILERLKTLRAQVMSKGGTTEQAIGVFDEAAFKTIVQAAMRAAYERAKGMR